MAQFSMDIHDLSDIEKIAIPEELKNDETYLEMVEAGQEVMLNSIKSSAQRHKRTGKMINSLKQTKAVIDKEGNAVGRVKFVGTDKREKTKEGKRWDITNWLKAFRIEYGTSTQKAEPFVAPAIASAESQIRNAIQKKFEEKIKK